MTGIQQPDELLPGWAWVDIGQAERVMSYYYLSVTQNSEDWTWSVWRSEADDDAAVVDGKSQTLFTAMTKAEWALGNIARDILKELA